MVCSETARPHSSPILWRPWLISAVLSKTAPCSGPVLRLARWLRFAATSQPAGAPPGAPGGHMARAAAVTAPQAHHGRERSRRGARGGPGPGWRGIRWQASPSSRRGREGRGSTPVSGQAPGPPPWRFRRPNRARKWTVSGAGGSRRPPTLPPLGRQRSPHYRPTVPPLPGIDPPTTRHRSPHKTWPPVGIPAVYAPSWPTVEERIISPLGRAGAWLSPAPRRPSVPQPRKRALRPGGVHFPRLRAPFLA